MPRRNLTRSEASAVARAVVSNFYDATPEGGHDEADFTDLTAQLSWFLSARVQWVDVDELYTAFDHLEKVENGTHPGLVRNTARTEDNTEELLERVDLMLDDAVHFLLSNAGFTGLAVAA